MNQDTMKLNMFTFEYIKEGFNEKIDFNHDLVAVDYFTCCLWNDK